jgi:predicted DNA-binding transcriptional regulator YafY
MPAARPYTNGDGDYLARWKRLLHLDFRLRSGTRPNAKALASECGVSVKTIYRDIEALRTDLDAPIAWDSARGGYYYSKSGFLIPAAALTEHELLAMMVAEQAVSQYEGTPLFDYLRAAFDKVLRHMPGEAMHLHQQVVGSIRFGGMPPATLDPAIWSALCAAVQHRERVTIEYLKPGEKKPGKRLLEPVQHLVRDREWFLVAWSNETKSYPMYYLPRIKSVERMAERFEPRKDFSPHTYWQDDFNAMERRGAKRAIVLRFQPSHAHLADERPWATNQKLRRHRDGSITIRFMTSALFEVRRQVLRFGGAVSVVSPPELRDEVAQAAVDLLRQHSATKNARK